MIIVIAFVIVFVIIFFSISAMKEEVLTLSKLRNIYLYLVSFVALMMILIGTIFTVQNITDVLFPTTYYYIPVPAEKGVVLSDEEKRISEENQKREQRNRETDNKKNVAKSIAVVLVALPTFIYHWRKIEKEKKEQA